MQIILAWKGFFIEWNMLPMKITNTQGKAVQYIKKPFVTIVQVVTCAWPNYYDAYSATISALDFPYLGGTAWDNLEAADNYSRSFDFKPFGVFLLFAFGQQPNSQPDKHPFPYHPHPAPSWIGMLVSCQTSCSATMWPGPTVIINLADAELLWEGSTVGASTLSLGASHCY